MGSTDELHDGLRTRMIDLPGWYPPAGDCWSEAYVFDQDALGWIRDHGECLDLRHAVLSWTLDSAYAAVARAGDMEARPGKGGATCVENRACRVLRSGIVLVLVLVLELGLPEVSRTRTRTRTIPDLNP